MPRPKTRNLPTPTTEEILAYDNVPVEVASRYIGSSTATLYRALQENRAPFGYGVHYESNWTYNISPGALVRYKQGELPTYSLRDIQDLAVDGIERILAEKLSMLKKLADAITI